jgi:hypothetical protein
VEVIQHKCGLLKLSDERKANIFTDYKKNSPRFAFPDGPNVPLALLVGETYGLRPMVNAAVPGHHRTPDSYYSKEILDVLSPDAIASLPFPSLGALLAVSCARYVQSRDVMFAMAAEQLVDGMDIDSAWCKTHLASLSADERQFACDLVAGKRDRMDDFSENKVTCYVADSQVVSNLRRIPGSGFAKLSER